jgi:predicted membrane channel-forming protein YqfA (hemolysin III family)
MAATKTKLVDSDQVSEEFRESYITSGYRVPGLSVRDCFRSLIQWHNETANVWSHVTLSTACLLLALYFQINGSVDFLTDTYALPLLASIVADAGCMLVSSVAHLCNCLSEEIRHVCFYFDYAAINMLGLSSAIGFYYYCRPVKMPFYEEDPMQYFTILIISCTVACYLTCASRHGWRNIRYALRLVAFGVPYTISLSPVFLRLVYAEHWETIHWLHLLHIGLTVGGSVINASKLPERLMPGRFNYIAHSHFLMHVICGTGILIQIYSLMTDMTTRKSTVDVERKSQPSVSNVFGPIRTLLILQAILIGHFTYKLRPQRTKLESKRK